MGYTRPLIIYKIENLIKRPKDEKGLGNSND